jgi:murein L,D-transpeptidase YcbB/YkuD
VWALAAAGALAVCLLLITVGVAQSGQLTRTALAQELSRSRAPPEVLAFYRARGDQPFWTHSYGLWPLWTGASLGPEARQMAAITATALPGEISGSTIRQVAAAVAAARSGRPQAAARAEVALSRALGEYGHGRSGGSSAAGLEFVDPAFDAPANALEALQQAAEAPSLAEHLAALRQGNPVYRALHEDLVAYRREWSGLPQVQIAPGPTLQLGAASERVGRLRRRLGLARSPDLEGGAVFDRPLAEAVTRFQAAHGLAATGQADAATVGALDAGAAHYERLILANLQRARLLPPPATSRFILVNPAAGKLWLYDAEIAKKSMRVVVGKRETQTPMMAGLLRYIVFNPYWEVPEDLVRSSIAPKVLRQGLSALSADHLQALSDWSDEAAPLDPAQIDWAAVAAGRQEVRVRQQPAGDNRMGAVKFMLPNELGIYLHDTPNKAAFMGPQRLLSAGCVRLERASDLVAWLLGQPVGDVASLGVDDRVDLREPTAVYITYLTAAPGPAGVTFYPDVYGRDPAALAALDQALQDAGPAHARGA